MDFLVKHIFFIILTASSLLQSCSFPLYENPFQEKLLSANADHKALLESVGFKFDYMTYFETPLTVIDFLEKDDFPQKDWQDLVIMLRKNEDEKFAPENKILYYFRGKKDIVMALSVFLWREMKDVHDPSCNSGTALNTAARSKESCEKSILFLLSKTPDINNDEQYVRLPTLYFALLYQRPAVAYQLAALGINLKNIKDSLIKEKEQWLVDLKAQNPLIDPHEQYIYVKKLMFQLSYIQSLFHAVESGDSKLMKIILHIDPSIPRWLRNQNGETLWHSAIRKNDTHILTVLWECASCWADLENYEGKTFVECALSAQHGSTDLLEFCFTLAQKTFDYENKQIIEA